MSAVKERTAEDLKLYPLIDTVELDCTDPDAKHIITVESDVDNDKRVPRITLYGHTEEELEAETVLARINGTMCGCMEWLHNWRKHHKFEVVTCDGSRWEVEYEVIAEA